VRNLTATVPTHWNRGNIRRFAQMKSGHTPSRAVPDYWTNTDIPWFTLADVWQLRDGKRTYLGATAATINELGLANSAAELLPTGTVVLSRTASVGFSGIMPRPMATSQDFWNWVCGPELLPEYLNYQFKSMTDELKSLNMGSTHQTIYQKDAATLQVIVPPIEEQRAIAEFLDRETVRIDTLIEEQQRLIELLHQRRTDLISHAVLDSTVERVQLRRLVDVIDCAHVTAEMVDDDVRFPVASIRECQTATVELSACTYTTPQFFELLRASDRAPQPGDLLFIRNVSVGLVSIVPSNLPEFAVGQETVLLRRKRDVHPSFLRYALVGAEARYAIERAMIGSTFRRINVSAIRSLPVPAPPLPIQIQVAAYLDEQTTRIDLLIGEARRFIELARERRAALITASVTGQIDVREMV
jgi:type I restriction enzyme, S subunit